MAKNESTKSKARAYAKGTVHDTNHGRLRVLEHYPRGHNGSRHPRCIVEFLDTGYVCNCQAGNIKQGKVADRRKPTVYGVGYLDWDVTIPPRGQHVLRAIYDLWANMLKRVYAGYYRSYKDCTVDKRWHSFKVFVNTVHMVEGFDLWLKDHSMHLDKDIKIPGNRVYTVDACKFVTASENSRAVKRRRWARASDSCLIAND